jgi:hypothetical protein
MKSPISLKLRLENTTFIQKGEEVLEEENMVEETPFLEEEEEAEEEK